MRRALGAQADLAGTPLPIGRHLGRRDRPSSGHLASPLRREIRGCRARALGGKGIQREGLGPRSTSLRRALLCRRRGACDVRMPLCGLHQLETLPREVPHLVPDRAERRLVGRAPPGAPQPGA